MTPEDVRASASSPGRSRSTSRSADGTAARTRRLTATGSEEWRRPARRGVASTFLQPTGRQCEPPSTAGRSDRLAVLDGAQVGGREARVRVFRLELGRAQATTPRAPLGSAPRRVPRRASARSGFPELCRKTSQGGAPSQGRPSVLDLRVVVEGDLVEAGVLGQAQQVALVEVDQRPVAAASLVRGLDAAGESRTGETSSPKNRSSGSGNPKRLIGSNIESRPPGRSDPEELLEGRCFSASGT